MTDVTPPEDAEDPKSSPDSVPVSSDPPEVLTEEKSLPPDEPAEKPKAPDPNRKIERRSDYRRPDDWKPPVWGGLSETLKQIYYEDWKEKDPEAAQRAWDEVQANNARIEANRLKREQEAEAKRLRKAAKSHPAGTAAKSSPAGVSLNVDADKVIVHFTVDNSSFLTDLQGPSVTSVSSPIFQLERR